MWSFCHADFRAEQQLAKKGVEVIFALLTAFFPIYMAFEAYKTAQAKQFGLPAPDPLGLDKMFGCRNRSRRRL